MQRFKKKILKELLLKSLAVGISVGVILTSILLLVCKLKGINLLAVFYVLIGLGSAAVISAIIFFLFKPNKIQMAKRLDAQLDLKQKIETMVEFENDDSLMLQLQRENAQEVLEKTPIKHFKMKFHWSLFVIPVIAIALLIPSLVVPMKADAVEEPPMTDPSYTVDDKTIQAILDMIKEIESRDRLDATVREGYVQELKDLITGLSQENLHESDKNALVLVTIQKALDICNEFTSYKEVSSVLIVSDSVLIRNLGKSLRRNVSEDTLNQLEYFRANIVGAENDAEVEKFLSTLRRDIVEGLKNSDVDCEKNISKAVNSFALNLSACAGEKDLKNLVLKAYATSLIDLEKALDCEELTSNTYQYIETQLRKIFNIKNENQNPENPDDTEPDDSTKEDDDTGTGGGIGPGDTVFAADELFFDPELGLVKYGDVISDYQSVITAMILEGKISPEMQEYFEAYFELLYGKQEENKQEN